METNKKYTFYWKVDQNGVTDCGVSRKGHSICRAPRYQEKEKWERDAKIICDAFESFERTGKTPEELEKENDRMAKLLTLAVSKMPQSAAKEFIEINQELQKFKTK